MAYGSSDDDGYFYSHPSLPLPLVNFTGEAWGGLNVIVNNTGFAFAGINDPSELEMDILIPNLLNNLHLSSELEGNPDAIGGNSPWDIRSNDPAHMFPVPEAECGDGEVNQPGETCDPPGSFPPDGAGNQCRNGGTDYQCTYCGDGILQEGAGEECDFNDPEAPENCNTSCELEPICGDGNVDIDLGETCDPPTGYCTGATLPRTSCQSDSDCPAGETCGLPVAPAGGGDPDRICRNGDGSPNQCTYCGDGIVQPNVEECDDGNSDNGDGCDNNCTVTPNPGIDIEKVTDSPDNQNTTPPDFDNEDNANGVGVPVIPAGSDIIWTYKVTNTGDVAFAKSDVIVQDSVAEVNGTLVLVDDADGDDILSPGEMWFYEATGTALDLLNPPEPLPDGVNIVEGCSNSFGDPQPPTATYMNRATVMADGLEDSDDSHYCGPPPPECEVIVTKTCVVPPPEDGDDGCTPGYWKQDQHFDSWVGYDPSDDFETVFGVDASFTTTLLGAMEQGGGGEYALGRHAVAALLNASSPDVDYFTDVAGVIAIVQGAYATSNFESAKNLLDFENNRGCPINSDSGTDGDGDNGSATVQQIGSDECEVLPGTEVTYYYEVENIGTVDISEVVVIDDPDPGDPFEVPGSPITDLGPGETETLESTAIINETTTNEVTVTGNPGPQECTATDTAQVTVIEAGEGCTPGYWKQEQHFGSWVGFDPSDDFETVFGVDASMTTTLLGALEQGGGGEYALGRHAVAALLNASSPDVDYFTDVAGVIALVQEAYASGDFEPAKDLLDLQNNLGCPLDRNPDNNNSDTEKIKEEKD
jgi:cysteine-rich repeat protein